MDIERQSEWPAMQLLVGGGLKTCVCIAMVARKRDGGGR